MARKELVAVIGTFLVSQGTSVQALLLLLLLSVSLLVQLRLRPFMTPFLNSLETASLCALLVSVFAGLFFLGHRDTASPFFRPGQDYALAPAVRWLLFLLILLANASSFLSFGSRLLRSARLYLRLKRPRCYLACCLCFNRRLLASEEQEHRQEEAALTVVERIDSVVHELEAFRSLYLQRADFADKQKFEQLLASTSQALIKLNRFKPAEFE